ncbi:ABC transporter ATP-binding protein [Methanobrevibacter smithii]|uniref:ABC transporter ATP-binding protein n=1 Tax=Methanobrevibacter smithii TaxID=2173 RepID=UPI0037DDAEE5
MAIEIKNINKSFHGRGLDHDIKVLDDVNLNIGDGEFVCLLGPSGCGKTTLLRLIAGLDQPTSGEVIADGEVVKKPSGDRGVIFQQYSLFPWLTVLENVMFGLNLKKDRTKEENLKAAERYLESVGLIDFKDSYPHELSGGMKQRVAIIRSLLNHSPILLMDEPFSALDMQNRHMLQEQLIGVWKRFKNTIVFVTHDVDEAIYLADKIVIMDKNPGKIKEVFDVDMPRLRKRESEEFIKIQEEVLDKLNVEDF